MSELILQVQQQVKVGCLLLLQMELHQQLREGLQEIAPQDREILTMRYALDYEVPDIAKALELQPSAVHMRLSRARVRLAEILKSMGVEAPK